MRRGLFDSRTAAQQALAEGRVTVGGVAAPKPASLVGADDNIRVAEGGSDRFVSRGGLKLDHGLDAFGVDPAGKRCLDAGASTGGFTDCLLQRGAVSVCAVDVGYGQLAWSIRTDQRVRVFDRTNLRHASTEELGGPFDLVVADLSFISLCTVADVLKTMAAPTGDLVLLVKPQFELDKGRVGKGGIVREPEAHAEAIRRVVECFDGIGIGSVAVTPSPLRGAKGNREFLIHLRPGPSRVTAAALEEATT